MPAAPDDAPTLPVGIDIPRAPFHEVFRLIRFLLLDTARPLNCRMMKNFPDPQA